VGLNIDYWRDVAKKVLKDDRAKVGYKLVSGVRSFKPATDVALQRIRYKLDEITAREKDEFGCFAVFTSLEAAKNFRERMESSGKILLVGYTLCVGSDKTQMWKKLPPHFVKSRYGKGYYAETSGTTRLGLHVAPRGTILAESIYVFGIVEI